MNSSLTPVPSVVIPVRNEAANIRACIDGVLAQTVSVAEIIVVDSGSTDGTLDILAQYPQVKVISIEPERFNHGAARNVGAKAAVSDWVILTVGDARAADDRWIEKLLAGVIDEHVVGVCGAQITPHERGANPVDWFRPASEPETQRYQFATANDFDKLSPLEKLHACSWDDVTALYHRATLLRFPFDDVMYAEDALWAAKVLRAGLALVYQPGARVNHYHLESEDFTFRRTILILCLRFRNFGYVYKQPGLTGPMVRTARRLMLEHGLSWNERLGWLVYNWKAQKAARAAVRVFSHALTRGVPAVDALCSRYSDRPPIPEKLVNHVTSSD